jgi:membrane protein required for beta-lactamase induction
MTREGPQQLPTRSRKQTWDLIVRKSVDTDRQTERKRTYTRVLGLTGTALATLVLLLWILPALLTQHPSSNLTDADRLKSG